MSNTSHGKVKPVQQALPFEPTFGEIEINGVSVVTATVNGKLLMSSQDIAKLMNHKEGRFARNWKVACKAKSIDIDMHLNWIMPPVGRMKKFIDLSGLWLICSILPHRTANIKGWLEVHATADKPAEFSTIHIAAKVFITEFDGHQVLLAFAKNRLWISPSSISRLLDYKIMASAPVALVLSRSKEDLSEHRINLRHSSGNPETFIDAHGMGYLFKRTGRGEVIVAWLAELKNWSEGVEALIRKVGGTDVHDAMEVVKPAAAPALPGVQSQSPTNGTPMASEPVPEIQAAAPTNMPTNDVGKTDVTAATVARLPKPTTPDTERKRDYCKKLCAVVARYLTADELPALAQALETFKGNILQKRYAPGLNDAAYELFANFHLRGPAVGQAGKEAQ